MTSKDKDTLDVSVVKKVISRSRSVSPAPKLEEEGPPEPVGQDQAMAASFQSNTILSPSLVPTSLKAVKTTESSDHIHVAWPRRVIFDKMYGKNELRLREFAECIVEGAVVITATPSQALTSVILATHLLEALQLPFIGSITTPSIIPKCIISECVPMHPIRIYGNKQIVIFISETKLPDTTTYHLAEAIMEFTKRHRCRMLLLVEGLPMSKESEPGVIRLKQEKEDDDSELVPDLDLQASLKEPAKYLGTDSAFIDLMVQEGLEQVSDGVIVGLTGAILTEAMMDTTPFGCLLIPAQSLYPDVQSAVRGCKLVAKICDMTIPTSDLEKRADQIVEGIMELIKAIQVTIKGDTREKPEFYS